MLAAVFEAIKATNLKLHIHSPTISIAGPSINATRLVTVAFEAVCTKRNDKKRQETTRNDEK
jgi:hypothetical protein